MSLFFPTLHNYYLLHVLHLPLLKFEAVPGFSEVSIYFPRFQVEFSSVPLGYIELPPPDPLPFPHQGLLLTVHDLGCHCPYENIYSY